MPRYTYAGMGDANPHAATNIAGTAYAYDNDGNVTKAGSWNYAWDYRNRMTSAGNGTATTTFAYDFQNQRVKKTQGSATTYYPNKYMMKAGATTTDYIYLGDTLIAEVEGGSSIGGGGGSVATSTIAFDATSTSITTASSGTTTKTWTHTVTGTNPVIVLTADLQQTATGTGSVASPTWNGGAFTKATSTRTNAMETEVWYLVATTTGAKTMSVTINGSTTAIRLGASSFTGVSPSWPLDVVKSANGNGGNPSISVTPTLTTDVVVSTLSKYGGGGGSASTSTSTPALIASAAAGASSNSVTTAAINTTGANFIVITLSYNTGATPTLSDNKGNTWTPLTATAVTSLETERLYYAVNPAVGTGHTFSNTGASNFSSICIAAFSGVATSSPFDVENGASNSASTIQPGSITPSVNQELAITGLAWNVARTTYPPTLDSSFTVSTSSNFLSGNHYGCSVGYLMQSNAAAVNPTWNQGSVQSNAARIASFKPLVTNSGGGGGTSADATSSQTTLFKSVATATFGGASYKIATTSGAITDTWTTATSQDWAMAAISLRPATTTSGGGAGTAATTTRYFHADYLNSTNVTTDKLGNVIQTLDYYPYGTTRINQSADASNEKHQFIGQYDDPETNLNYLNARYYDSGKGEFLSEDPMFLGDPKQQVLTDPQSLNSYSYANDNPIVHSDPTGLLVSEYQPYLPLGNTFGYGQAMGSYRNTNIFSHGSLSPIDDSNKQQCVDFVQRFVTAQFGISLANTGHAVSYGDQNAVNASMSANGNRGALMVYNNNNPTMPQENDILSWTGEGYGHVGIVAEVSFNPTSGTGYVYSLEQNFRRDQALFSQPLTRNADGTYTVGNRTSDYTVQAWARYGSQNTVPQYTTTPWTPAPKLPLYNNNMSKAP